MGRKHYIHKHIFYVISLLLMLSFSFLQAKFQVPSEIEVIKSEMEKIEKLLKEGKQYQAEKLFERIIPKVQSQCYRIKHVYSSDGLTLENYPYYLYLLIEYYQDKRAIDTAIETCRKIIKKYPESHFPDSSLLLAPSAQIKVGDLIQKIAPEEAIKEYEKAIDVYRKTVEKYPQYYEEEWGYPAATAQLRIVRIYRKYLRNPKKAI